MDVRTKRTTPAMLAKKRAQVASDRAKEKAFREERIPLLARLGEVDALVTKYHWAVEMGAEAVVEMREQMEKEEAEDRWLQIAAEARGSWATPSTAGPSRPTAPRANSAPRANNNNGTVGFTGTIPKYHNRVWVAKKEEREKFRSACGYRGGSSTRARTHSKHGGHRARGGSSHHQPSAGLRDSNGDRVTHPRQDRGTRAGAGQSARHAGHRSAVDSHGRNFGAESTDWSEWEEEEGGQAE